MSSIQSVDLIGHRLSHFRITAKLGEGGMGEVYRAEDTKLGREVAIKVLPADLTADVERLARFEREARVLASLNHPNIAGIYEVGSFPLSPRPEARGAEAERSRDDGDGSLHSAAFGPPGRDAEDGELHFLVMELVEGETLQEVIDRGPIPVEQALEVALQTIRALEAAHEKGIVHRDLKPANVKVAPEGSTGVQVKVLDFGLAKAWEPEEESSPALSMSPTLTAQMTQAGVILGTAAYMSPEQARGQAVDKRSDIWSFGVMLYEMLTGGQAFRGDTVTDLIAAVVTKEPDAERLPPELPSRVRRLLGRCLEKDSMQRLRDIGEARIEIQAALAGEADEPVAVAAAERAAPSRSGWLWPALAAAGLAGTVVMGALYVASPEPAPAPATWFEIPVETPTQGFPSVSPDGRTLAFQRRSGEAREREVWLRRLDALEPTVASGPKSMWGPTPWSPDGREILFSSFGKLYRLDLSGGPPRALADLPGGYAGAVWGADGVILLGSFEHREAGIYRLPEAGGTPVRLTRSPEGESDGAHAPGSLLPDGRHFLYSRFVSGANSAAYVGSIDAAPDEQPTTPLVSVESVVTYLPKRPGDTSPGTGHILFVLDGALRAQPFDADELTVAGDPVTIAEGLTKNGWGYSASPSGVLAFKIGVTASSEIVRFDRSGERLGTIGEVADYAGVVLAPDGEYLAVTREAPGEPTHLWMVELDRGVFTRVNPGDERDYSPAVSSDGRVAFTIDEDIFVRRTNGVGEMTPVVVGESVKHACDWTPDSRYLIYDDHVGGG